MLPGRNPSNAGNLFRHRSCIGTRVRKSEGRMEKLLRDLRYAFRLLLKHPAFTAIVDPQNMIAPPKPKADNP